MCIDTFLTLEGVTKDCRVPGLTATTYIQYSNKVLETKNITHPSFANIFQVEERETQKSLGQKTLHDLLCKLLSIIDKKELYIFLYQPLSRVEISVSLGGQSHTFDNQNIIPFQIKVNTGETERDAYFFFQLVSIHLNREIDKLKNKGLRGRKRAAKQ